VVKITKKNIFSSQDVDCPVRSTLDSPLRYGHIWMPRTNLDLK